MFSGFQTTEFDKERKNFSQYAGRHRSADGGTQVPELRKNDTLTDQQKSTEHGPNQPAITFPVVKKVRYKYPKYQNRFVKIYCSKFFSLRALH